MSKPVLSVVIPTHLRSASLEAALRSFHSQDLERSRFELIVVSNLEDQNVQHIVAKAGARGLDAKHVIVGQIGVNRARNAGLELAKGDVIFFLDDDCRLSRPDHLSQLVLRFQAEPAFSIRGGLYRDSTDATSTARSYNAVVNAWVRGHDRETKMMVGGNLAVLRSAIGATRFDEAIVYGGSEVGFQLELARRGYRSKLDADLAVIHDFRASVFTVFRKAWRQGYERKPGTGASLAAVAVELAKTRRLAFGLCYGGISRVASLSAELGRSLPFGDRPRVLAGDGDAANELRTRRPR